MVWGLLRIRNPACDRRFGSASDFMDSEGAIRAGGRVRAGPGCGFSKNHRVPDTSRPEWCGQSLRIPTVIAYCSKRGVVFLRFLGVDRLAADVDIVDQPLKLPAWPRRQCRDSRRVCSPMLAARCALRHRPDRAAPCAGCCAKRRLQWPKAPSAKRDQNSAFAKMVIVFAFLCGTSASSTYLRSEDIRILVNRIAGILCQAGRALRL